MAEQAVAGYRVEKDSMGEMQVPQSAYYGAQTQRAVLNFPVSGYRMPRPFIRAMGLIKQVAAEVNAELGKLPADIAKYIIDAAQEVIDGKLDAEFPVDVFQTGSGTSTNMNANEVIAHRARELAGADRASKKIHPNDHVNMGQSSNDVIPTAMHLALAYELKHELAPSLEHLGRALSSKAKAFDHIVKIGRTHLQDATPIRLGQVFSGYEAQVTHAEYRVHNAVKQLRELPIGGTAVGTGINTHIEFGSRVAAKLQKHTGIEFVEANNHFEAQAAKDAVVEASGFIRTVAVGLSKVANDIRWLASGPRCGIGEILIPAVQPGSSIMPGKVNPVMSESLLQACAHVIGVDATVVWSASMGSTFELCVMMPVMAHHLLEAVRVLSRAVWVFTDFCVVGIESHDRRCSELIEQSLAMCTSLAPIIGYDAAAAIAKESYATRKTVRQVATEKRVLPPAELDKALDIVDMTKPGASGATAA